MGSQRSTTQRGAAGATSGSAAIKEPWQMTPKQYHDSVIASTRQEYGVTKHEAEDAHPVTGTQDDHFQAVLAHVRAGGTIPSGVLDKLTAGQRYHILHDYPGRHDTYLPPETRKANAVAKQEGVAARQRGRTASQREPAGVREYRLQEERKAELDARNRRYQEAVTAYQQNERAIQLAERAMKNNANYERFVRTSAGTSVGVYGHTQDFPRKREAYFAALAQRSDLMEKRVALRAAMDRTARALNEPVGQSAATRISPPRGRAGSGSYDHQGRTPSAGTHVYVLDNLAHKSAVAIISGTHESTGGTVVHYRTADGTERQTLAGLTFDHKPKLTELHDSLGTFHDYR